MTSHESDTTGNQPDQILNKLKNQYRNEQNSMRAIQLGVAIKYMQSGAETQKIDKRLRGKNNGLDR